MQKPSVYQSLFKTFLRDLACGTAVRFAPTGDAGWSGDPTQRARILAEQFELLHRSTPAGSFGTLAAVVILMAILWGHMSETALLGWVLVMTVISGLQLAFYFGHLAKQRNSYSRNWSKRGLILSFTLEAVGWGSTVSLLWPSDFTYQLSLLLVISMVATVVGVYFAIYLPALYLLRHTAPSACSSCFIQSA